MLASVQKVQPFFGICNAYSFSIQVNVRFKYPVLAKEINFST